MAKFDFGSDYEALFRFEKSLRDYCEKSKRKIDALVQSTNSFFHSDFRGDVAKKIHKKMDDDIKCMTEEINELNKIADVVHDAAVSAKKMFDELNGI